MAELERPDGGVVDLAAPRHREAAMGLQTSNTQADLDPIHLYVQAEERLMGLRQNLTQQVYETAMRAGETAKAEDLDALVRLYTAIQAIDFAIAHKPSAYKMSAPI
jgi:hypothetical protein